MRVEQCVLAVLSAAEVEGNKLVLVGQLDRKLYERTNKVLEAAGGKWNRGAKAHVFDGDAGERIDQIILTESVEIPKDEFEYFPTPPEVVAALMHEIEPCGDGDRVLEPSAGQGHIALTLREAGCEVDTVELSPKNAEVLLAKGFQPIIGDFLQVEPRREYDLVAMNPPFSKQQDIKHVLHALGFLKPDGMLVSVMSAGVTFRQDKRATEFRALVESRGGRIEPLPDGAFKSSGTMVNTVIAVIPGA